MTNLLQTISIIEGITHIEDLDVEKFISTLQSLGKFIATEKLDGFNYQFGIDTEGKLYTSREGKGRSDRYYRTSQFPDGSASAAFKAAHLGIMAQETKISQVLEPGEAIEVEVLFGRQPNAITYGLGGDNFITLLRAVQGSDPNKKPDQSRVGELAKVLANAKSRIKTTMLNTVDGEHLQKAKVEILWKFVKPQQIDTSQLISLDFKKDLGKLKKFLQQQNDEVAKAGLNLTNLQVLQNPLTSVSKDFRDIVKSERERLSSVVLNDYKLPIKEKILDAYLRKMKPTLQDQNVSSDEDLGIEGVVLLDPETQDQIKIVDKDVFTALNSFNQSVRRKISGIVKTDNPKADKDSRGGIYGEALIRIAQVFDTPELAKASSVKKIFRKYKGRTSEETARNFAESLKSLNYLDAQRKCVAILNETAKEVKKELQDFKSSHPSFKLKLKSGKEVGYTEEIVRRTLLAFAELIKKITSTVSSLKKSESMDDIILALFKPKIDEVSSEITEAKLNSLFRSVVLKNNGQSIKVVVDDNEIENKKLEQDPRRNELKNMTADEVFNAYLGTMLGALLLLRGGCPHIGKILHDPKHKKLLKYDKKMGTFNFWGLVLFYPENKEIKPYLRDDTYKVLWKTAGRFLTYRIKTIHDRLSHPDHINWTLEQDDMRLVTLRLERRTPSINKIRDIIENWDQVVDANDKAEVFDDVYVMLMGGDPTSPILPLLKKFSENLLLTATSEPEMSNPLLKTVNTAISEEGEGGGGEAGSSSGGGDTTPATPTINAGDEVTTTSGAVGSKPVRLFKNKIISRRPRKFKVIPQFLKDRKVTKGQK